MAKGTGFPEADMGGKITDLEYLAILELFKLAAAAKVEDPAASRLASVPSETCHSETVPTETNPSETINLGAVHFDLNAVHFPAADEATKASNLEYLDFLLPLIKESSAASAPMSKPYPAAASAVDVVMAATSVVDVVTNMGDVVRGYGRSHVTHEGNEALYNVFLRWLTWTQPHISFGKPFPFCNIHA